MLAKPPQPEQHGVDMSAQQMVCQEQDKKGGGFRTVAPSAVDRLLLRYCKCSALTNMRQPPRLQWKNAGHALNQRVTLCCSVSIPALLLIAITGIAVVGVTISRCRKVAPATGTQSLGEHVFCFKAHTRSNTGNPETDIVAFGLSKACFMQPERLTADT